MNQSINLKTTTLAVTNSINPATAGRGLLFVALLLAWFALSSAPNAFGVTPAPDGGYPNNNTAEGTDALKSLTSGGFDNTAIGFQALFNNTDGGGNTAAGRTALNRNTIGVGNTAVGVDALVFNVTGNFNTANGSSALVSNTDGDSNTATGSFALNGNTTGNDNTATGVSALRFNTTGNSNTATGAGALNSNTTGSNNIALGANAGINLTTGSNNIDIGAGGVAGESNTIRIGVIGLQKSAYIRGISGATVASGVGVIVDSRGHLGTVQSSERFKEAIKPMDKASEAILALKPVTFRYKKELDPENISQFGLIAEQVEKVNPDLVARDEEGQVYTVRYEAVNAMLLNEFLKEHRKVQEQQTRITEMKSAIARQEATNAQLKSGLEALTATVKEQASQIQKVNARLEMSRPAPQMADNQ